MPFFKQFGEAVVAVDTVYAPTFTLTEATKDQSTYPIDNWVWAANLEDALTTLPDTSATCAYESWLWALKRRKDLTTWDAALTALAASIAAVDADVNATNAQKRDADRNELALNKWAKGSGRLNTTSPWFARLIAAYRTQSGMTANQTTNWVAATLTKAKSAPLD